jgi:hypothetical protein
MELRRLTKIIGDYKTIWIGIMSLTLALGFLFFISQKQAYKVVLGLNVTRQGHAEAGDYQYGDYYRLQADEKFADTVSRWLADPRIVSDILQKSGETAEISKKKLAGYFKPERLSSQYIRVGFDVSQKKSAEAISKSLTAVINGNTDELNKNQGQTDWFIVISGEPMVFPKSSDIFSVIFVSLAVGFIIAFWVVLIKYYWDKEYEDRN